MNESTTKDIVDRNAAADRIAVILAQIKPSSEDVGRSEDGIMQDTIADIAEARQERRTLRHEGRHPDCR